jgi:hypothetical protein
MIFVMKDVYNEKNDKLLYFVFFMKKYLSQCKSTLVNWKK